MDYTIIKPKTVYTVTLKTYPEVYKCSGCGYSQIAKTKFGHRKATCINPCGCYREFNTETKAREWLDKIEKYESSVDAGLLTAAGENPYLGQKDTCRDCGCEIEYIGPYWRHIGNTPRHIAIPSIYKGENK